jgi:putative ABC transport system permease protein
MIDLAFRLLFGDRGKYALLLSGIGFATLLMIQGLALFCGLLAMNYGTSENIRAPIWVTDPQVQQVIDRQPMRDIEVNLVRSVPGVKWAAPLALSNAQVRLLEQGLTKQVSLVGLDGETLAGAPRRMIMGELSDLLQPDSVIIDQRAVRFLSTGRKKPITVGDEFELNDNRAVVVGIVRTKMSEQGMPYIFTTYERAERYAPAQRTRLTHILAAPEDGVSVADLCARITAETGLKARTEKQIRADSAWFLVKNSPVIFVVGFIVGIGFLVGTVISGQTFYGFVTENMRHLGTLKAMGASDARLMLMVCLQALLVAIAGYGLGGGLIALLFGAMPEDEVPLLVLWQVPVVVFAAVVSIALVAAALAIWRVVRIEPAIVFRA